MWGKVCKNAKNKHWARTVEVLSIKDSEVVNYILNNVISVFHWTSVN